MKKTITLTIGGNDYSFSVTVQDHSDFIDSAARGESMSAAAHNFVIRTVTSGSKDEFKKLLDNSPGAALQIAGMLKAEYSPVLDIAVKK